MPQSDQNQKVIALIEDEKIISQLLVKKLEAAGYLVKTADNGEAGILLIKDLKPDLILLDMMLPQLDGFGVLEGLRNEHIIPRIPLIIISNSGQPIEVGRALELGARDYLIKVNFDPQDVVTKVRQILSPVESRSSSTGPNPPAQTSSESPEETSSPQKTTIPPPARSSLDGRSGSLHIILIDDDLMLVQLLERKLIQQKKYEVHKAFDVPQARTMLAQYGADIILLDIVLPGTDGFTFLSELKTDQRWKNIPVIIMSNLGQQEEVKRGMENGAVDYIVKAHTSPQEIVEKIDAVLKKIY